MSPAKTIGALLIAGVSGFAFVKALQGVQYARTGSTIGTFDGEQNPFPLTQEQKKEAAKDVAEQQQKSAIKTAVDAVLGLFGKEPTTSTTSLQLDQLYDQYGKQYDINPSLIKAIATVESGGNFKAINPADPAYGLMQVLCVPDGKGGCANTLNVPGWDSVTSEKLLDPSINIYYGVNILKWNLDTYGYPKGIAVYNKWSARNEVGEPFSNQAYVDKVKALFNGNTTRYQKSL